MTFTDTLDPGMEYVDDYSVTSDSGTTIATASLPQNNDPFTYTFPANAGYHKYVITYKTKMTDPTKLVAYGNTGKVTGGVFGNTTTSSKNQYDNTYKGSDTTVIRKSIVNDDSIDTGVVQWKVALHPGDIIKNSTNLTFVDKLTGNWQASGVNFNTDSLQVTDTDGTAVNQSEYTVVWGALQSDGTCSASGTISAANASCFDMTFTDKALDQGDIILSYSTTAKKPNQDGTYGNKAILKKDDASFTSSQNVTVPPNAISKTGTATWDKTTATWGIDYSIDVNKNTDPKIDRAGIDNLHGQPVTLVDTLGSDPKDPTRTQQYVKGSAKYTVTLADDNSVTQPLDPQISDNGSKLTFTVPTDGICSSTGPGVTDPSCYANIHLTYRVTVPTNPYGTTTYDNSVTGNTRDAVFTKGSTETTVNTNVLDKEGVQVTGQPQAGYTIHVNKNAQKLETAESAPTSLQLVDSLDYRTSLIASSVLVCKGDLTISPNGSGASCNDENADITSSSDVRQEQGVDANQHPIDKLAITVPDATYVSVFYRVLLNGAANSTLNDVINKAELEGIVNSGIENKTQLQVIKATGGTSGSAGSIIINKVDGADANKSLQGAEFQLFRLDDATSWDGTSAGALVDTRTTDSKGSLTFNKDDTTLLDLNTLYYFVESKAPQGYHRDTSRHYFILENDEQSAGFDALMDQVKDKTGEYPAFSSSYTVSDLKFTSVSYALQVQKKLEGGTLHDGEFTFRLHDGDADGPVLQTKTNGPDGRVNFDAINYDHEGTFTYTITEDKGSQGGVTYSDEPIHASVTVKDDGTGKLVATPSYGDTIPTIVNTYAASGVFTPKGMKTLQGRAPVSSDSFSFTVTDANKKIVSTGKVADLSKSGDIAFTPIPYTTADAGKTFQYTVTEDSTDDKGSTLPEGVTATTSSLSFTVRVEDNGDGSLKITPSYPDASDHLSFVNTYATKQQVPLRITGVKNLLANGTDTTIGDFGSAFGFTLSGTDDAGKPAPLPTNADGVTESKAVNDKLGNIDFGTITYRQSDLAGATQKADGSREKLFHYIVKESAKQPDGVTADASPTRRFDVKVTDDGLGHMTAVASPVLDKQTATDPVLFRFTNKYAVTPVKSSVTDRISMTKKLVNATLKTGEFHFQMTDVQTGKVLRTASNQANGSIAFDPIEYTTPGVHHYTVTEQVPKNAITNAQGRPTKNGVTYDTHVFGIVVTVKDDHDGSLSTTTTQTDQSGKVTNDRSIEFVNTAQRTTQHAVPQPPLTKHAVLSSTGSDITPIAIAAALAGLIGLTFVTLSAVRRGDKKRNER